MKVRGWIWFVLGLALGLCIVMVMGCAAQKDYSKISNQQACGQDDCGKQP